MLKKIARDLTIVFCFLALYASTSRTAMKYLSDLRDADTWWGTYQLANGDLVSMSALDFVKTFKSPRTWSKYKKPVYTNEKKIALYLNGDSNVLNYHLNDSDYKAVAYYHIQFRYSTESFKLDTTKKNIFIIEIGERMVRDYFSTTKIIDDFYDANKKKSAFVEPLQTRPMEVNTGAIGDITGVGVLFNKYLNQNLQFNLFNYQFLTFIFGYKAAINFYVFNRASGDVVFSDDKRFLLLKETVATTGKGSSYSQIPREEIVTIGDNLNTIYDHYKAAGFKEVYLSIIPTTATIVQPNGYNKLIPMIQNDPRLKIKVLDIYSIFQGNEHDYFLHGDTHWSLRGIQRWLQLVNDTLVKYEKN